MEVANLQERAVDVGQVEAMAAEVLRAEGRAEVALSVALVDDTRMTELHVEFMGEAGPTDVLSFPLEGDTPPEAGPPLLGEVVVCTDVAAREAQERGLPEQREVLLYVAHGTLHLLGYDDHDSEERARMEARQEALVERVWGQEGSGAQ